jgi:A/G-specific adenine glycosylase
MHAAVLGWYARAARDLPWRRASAGPWAVLVSEVMLQQTPVARVVPVYDAWLARWPTPATLAADAPAEPIRAWGRLGYPRRALRLHAAATVITARHGGDVPPAYDELRALPGIGDYTAAAVAAFAFGSRHPVLDTNVRRVLARALGGVERPPPVATAAERRRAAALLPDTGEQAAAWSVAVMELGALVCTSRSPACAVCPIADGCVWRRAGRPAYEGGRRVQAYAGTDRQARGRLLAVLRDAAGPVPDAPLVAACPEPAQRARALGSLVADGLVEPLSDGRYRLPGATDRPPLRLRGAGGYS